MSIADKQLTDFLTPRSEMGGILPKALHALLSEHFVATDVIYATLDGESDPRPVTGFVWSSVERYGSMSEAVLIAGEVWEKPLSVGTLALLLWDAPVLDSSEQANFGTHWAVVRRFNGVDTLMIEDVYREPNGRAFLTTQAL